MSKKTIILVLVLLIVINTFYWTNLISRLIGPSLYESKLLISLYLANKEYTVKNLINLLAITDAVLIAIYFMIILLYKKD